MNLDFKNYLLKTTQATDCKEIEVIQSLWSGYGKISSYQLSDAAQQTVVVKHIALNEVSKHPRGWDTNYAHNRKVKSYQVETQWYEKWSQVCDDNCRVPKFIGSFSQGADQWIILEDLNPNFPVRKQQIDLVELKVCLKWLANFHATFLHQEPKDLWEVGTYWHLKTRPEEFEKIEHQELKAKAHLIDEALNQCQFQTIVHGDAKLANFCFSATGDQVSGVDFQYVGGGCGMKDVAYFFGSCLSSTELEVHEVALLDFYFSELVKAVELHELSINYKELEDEWRKMYPIACADFTRFLLGWMPLHQKVNAYNLKLLNSVLSNC